MLFVFRLDLLVGQRGSVLASDRLKSNDVVFSPGSRRLRRWLRQPPRGCKRHARSRWKIRAPRRGIHKAKHALHLLVIHSGRERRLFQLNRQPLPERVVEDGIAGDGDEVRRARSCLCQSVSASDTKEIQTHREKRAAKPTAAETSQRRLVLARGAAFRARARSAADCGRLAGSASRQRSTISPRLFKASGFRTAPARSPLSISYSTRPKE